VRRLHNDVASIHVAQAQMLQMLQHVASAVGHPMPSPMPAAVARGRGAASHPVSALAAGEEGAGVHAGVHAAAATAASGRDRIRVETISADPGEDGKQ